MNTIIMYILPITEKIPGLEKMEITKIVGSPTGKERILLVM